MDDGFVLDFAAMILNLNDLEFRKESLGLFLEPLKFIYFFTEFAARKGKARMEAIVGCVNFVHFHYHFIFSFFSFL